ncbi:prepilin-type N-terminal cleavage/methylation domain-containing protein [bacterium]|nr:prepilin-type N-terminal cleavage/methylation domain-containing protein [bacterium]
MKFFRTKKGFTLIELMIVVVIIGILAALAIPRFMKASLKAKISEAKGLVKQIYTLNQAFYQEQGHFVTGNRLTEGTTWEGDGETTADSIGFDLPTGTPRFDYYVRAAGAATALPNGADNAVDNNIDSVVITAAGNIEVYWQ